MARNKKTSTDLATLAEALRTEEEATPVVATEAEAQTSDLNTDSILEDAEALIASMTPAPRPNRAPCDCGCGGTPSGKKARYLPGHDARHHAQISKDLRKLHDEATDDEDENDPEVRFRNAIVDMQAQCGSAWGECVTARGNVCNCDCAGENHGMLHQREAVLSSL